MPFRISGRCSFLGALSVLFAGYSFYVYTAGTTQTNVPSLTEEVRAGFGIFQGKNCIACHQLFGLGGYMGPDLTNVVSAPGKGVDYARGIIAFGTARMPDFGLSEPEIESLIHLLEFTAASGPYPPPAPKLNWNGTVDYDGETDAK